MYKISIQRVIGAGFLLAACFGIVGLSRCSSTSTAPVATVATQLQQICQAAQPLQQQIASATAANATAQNLSAYFTSACAADGTVAATLAPNITTTTPTWLENVITAFETAAKIAPLVLPLL